MRQKFSSKERDIETGLDYFGARFYSATMGRFTSPDPLDASARPLNPQSWNRYSYVLNRPLALIDPNGMHDCTPRTPCEKTTADDAEKKTRANPKLALIQESVTIVDTAPTQTLTTASIVSQIVSITPKPMQGSLFPGGDQSSDRPDENVFEKYASDPLQTAFEVINWASEGISNVAYSLTPDYFFISGGIPLVGSGALQYSKDGHLYWSLAGPTAGAKNFKFGWQAGAAYFLTTKMTPEQRENSIMGPGTNINTPYNPFGAYIPSSGTPAITISGPLGFGVNRSATWKIF